MDRSIGFAAVLASVAACGARAEGGDASASASSSDDADIAPGPFAIDFPRDKEPYCVTTGETVHDYVASGDGSAIACEHAAGTGGGPLPAGVSIDSATCAVVGEPPADRYGTWVVIVKATQGDVDVFVPYCITRDQQQDGDALVEVVTAASDGAALLPLHGTFDAGAPIAAGGADDPLFRVTDATRCGETCAYSYTFFLSPSPFDVMGEPVIVDTMLVEEDGDRIGVSHGLAPTGPPVAEMFPELAERPWVFGLDLDYCLAESSEDCKTSGSHEAEVAARFRYSVVMSPD